MKEITDVLAAWRQCRSQMKPAALATVVRVDGSAYRRPGARMLILGDGTTIGSVSGGCIERDVIYRSGAVIGSKTPILVRYDSVSEEEAGPGTSLGCGGTIDVLIEAVEATDDRALGLVEQLWRRREYGVIATQISGDLVGRHVAMDSESLPSELAEQARAALGRRASRHFFCSAAGWAGEWFLELIQPPLELVIFGAGADAVPVAAQAKALGWHVKVIDLRSGPASASRRFDADDVVRRTVDEAMAMPISQDAAVVVMTHNYRHDLAILSHLARGKQMYAGILGPRRRTEQMLLRIKADFDFDPSRLRYPIGLDIGARTPEEIALAIVAEITAVLRGGTGGPLRHRTGPIHAQAANSAETTCPVAAL